MREYLLSRKDSEPSYTNGVQTIDITGEKAEQTFQALSSQTSREVLELLYDNPSTPVELADELDTSPQNIHYHLRKLVATDLIESVDTVYSSRGTEMDVYAPTNEAFVLLSGEESKTTQIRTLLKRFLGGLGVLTIVSLLLQLILSMFGTREVASGPSPSTEPWFTSSETLGLQPGLFLFVGGLVILLMAIWWMYRDIDA